MTDEPGIERRSLLRAITAASGTALSLAVLSRPAAACPTGEVAAADSEHFETAEIGTGNNTIFIRLYGRGSPLLMVHGFPRTSLMWRYVAPRLASNHTVICVDLRGYGRSGLPASAEDHYPYSKRAMANELVAVMDKLGFSEFDLVGHDRGGRVSYRLALDHPGAGATSRSVRCHPDLRGMGPRRCEVRHDLLAMASSFAEGTASGKIPLGCSGRGIRRPVWPRLLRPRSKSGVHRNLSRSRPGHAICEEYRAAATLDIEHDRKDLEEFSAYHLPNAASVGCRRTTRYLLRTGWWLARDLAEVG